MIPVIRLKTAPVTSSQPPQSRTAALSRSVRAPRLDTHISRTAAISAAGSSQLICPPISDPNSRARLAWPLNAGLPPPRPPLLKPTEPVSLPSSRPRPL